MNKTKVDVISIFGMGYVSSTMAACFASRGFKVIGVEINDKRIRAINRGQSPMRARARHDYALCKCIPNSRSVLVNALIDHNPQLSHFWRPYSER